MRGGAEMKTNITVASNIFSRKDNDIRRDPDFVAQITGRPALQKIINRYGTDRDGNNLDGVTLSDWQKKMNKGELSCNNGEMTHGLVRKDGQLFWQGRCEYSACDDFETCSETAHYIRDAIMIPESPDRDTSPLTYEWLGSIEGLFQDELTDEQSPEDIAPPEVVIADVKSFVAQDEFEKIENPARIVEADISDKILVNAAPGSGKTYTVIRRLAVCRIQAITKSILKYIAALSLKLLY